MGLGGAIGAAIGAALAVNFTLFMSALPAVAGKGAPYMPTLRKSLDVVFGKVLPKLKPVEAGKATPIMVDLGSGDGRVVIEAARHGYRAVGYELNPMLVAVSHTWAFWDQHLAHRVLKNRKPWPETASVEFKCRDLWKVNLSNADIILVYGLSPIMDRLSVKLMDECKDDVLIFSNVFTLPEAWRRIQSSEEVHVLYALSLLSLDRAWHF
mmetsp:Transcript_7131/g.14318  ORF Transcript_7131/g.14318 Transcript_7131/m.14318 type:complete len:210 (+) Transcript_7131:338-967(+)